MSNFFNRSDPKTVLKEQLGTEPTSSPASQLAAGFLYDSDERQSRLSAFGSSGVSVVPRRLEKDKHGSPDVNDRLGGGLGESRSQGHSTTVTAPPEHQPAYQPKHAAQYPTDEDPSGSAVGVGSLPGRNVEFGVARLPEERGSGNPHIYSHSTVSATVFTPQQHLFKSNFGMTHGSDESTGLGTMPAKMNESGGATPRGNIIDDIHSKIQHHFSEGDHHAMSRWDMPSKEEPSGARCGVGSLPGSKDEAGVAVLPDETHPQQLPPPDTAFHRKMHHHFAEGVDHHAMSKWDLPSKEAPSGARCGVGSLPGPNKEAGVALFPDERPHHHPTSSMRTSQQMPSTESPSGSSVGVGSLPWEPNDRGVALLPEERLHPANDILTSHLPPRMDQMPSMEHPSGSTVGVGSLPGERGEEGVALSPEEREHPAFEILATHPAGDHEHGSGRKHWKKGRPETHFTPEEEARREQMPSTEHAGGSRVGVGSLPGARSEQKVALTPEERLHPADEILMSHLPPRMDQMPSMEHISGSTVGVGSLPGKRSEQRVALTPEERLHPADDILMSHLPPRMDQMPSMEHPSGSSVGVGSLPGRRDENGVALTPEERHHLADQILKSHQPKGHRWSYHRRRGSDKSRSAESKRQRQDNEQEREHEQEPEGEQGHRRPFRQLHRVGGSRQLFKEHFHGHDDAPSERVQRPEQSCEGGGGEAVTKGGEGSEAGEATVMKERGRVRRSFGWGHPGGAPVPSGTFDEDQQAVDRGRGKPLRREQKATPSHLRLGGGRVPNHTEAGETTPTPGSHFIPAFTTMDRSESDPQPVLNQAQDALEDGGQRQSYPYDDSGDDDDELAARQLREAEEMMGRTKLEEEMAGAEFAPAPAPYEGGLSAPRRLESATPPVSGLTEPFPSPESSFGDVMDAPPVEIKSSVPAYLRTGSPRTMTAPDLETGELSDVSLSERTLTDENGAPVYLDEFEIDKEEVGWGEVVPGDETVRYRAEEGGHRHHHHHHHHQYHPLIGHHRLPQRGRAHGHAEGEAGGEQGRTELTGAHGVTFSLEGEGGRLPGYPTKAGMSKLVRDRMADDQIRAAGGHIVVSEPSGRLGDATTPTPAMTRTDSGLSTRAVRGSSSDLTLDPSTLEDPVTVPPSGEASARFTGNMTPRGPSALLDVLALGKPLPPSPPLVPVDSKKVRQDSVASARRSEQRKGIN